VNKADTPAGYQFWSFFWWYSILRGFIEETFRANPLYGMEYINEHLGIGFTTLTQLATPLLLAFTWYFLVQTMRTSSFMNNE